VQFIAPVFFIFKNKSYIKRMCNVALFLIFYDIVYYTSCHSDY